MESNEQVEGHLPSSHLDHHEHHHHGGHEHEHHHEHVICYTVDGERQETRKHILTPLQILTDAGIDPVSYYLVRISGHHRESYKDKPDEPIHLHEHEKFVSVYMAPTPVS